MTSNLALRYYLPKTVLDVGAQVRYVVEYDSVGGHLEPRVDVRVTPRVVPDRSARCTTNFAAVLESASLGVQLTQDGLIEAVGSHVHGRPGPAANPLGRSSSGGPAPTLDAAAAGSADLALRAGWTRPGSLRAAFDRSHPRTAALIADLSARAEQFLAGMRMGDGPAEVEVFGSALAVVERELAAADRMRREWIAAQGFDVRSGRWDLDLTATVVVAEPLPDTLPADTPVPAGAAEVLARDYGVLIALADPDGDPGFVTGSAIPQRRKQGLDRVDEILLRQPRPVTVAVYRRRPGGIGQSGIGQSGIGEPGAGPDAGGEWTLDPELTQHLDAVDQQSGLEVIGPEGHLAGERAMHVSFHPGGSVSAFGVSSAAAAAVGGMGAYAVETSAASDPGVPSQRAVAAAALEAARLQLALLQASDEFTRLAATHAHGGELTTLEQDARFAALRSMLP